MTQLRNTICGLLVGGLIILAIYCLWLRQENSTLAEQNAEYARPKPMRQMIINIQIAADANQDGILGTETATKANAKADLEEFNALAANYMTADGRPK